MSFSTLSVAEYLKVADLTPLVNASVNSCVAARPHPSLVPAFLSQHFHALHFESPTAVAVQAAELTLSGFDGTGSPQLAVTVSLADGRSGSAVVAHSCGASVSHPSTSRVNRRLVDSRHRAQRASAVFDLAGLSQLHAQQQDQLDLLSDAAASKQSPPNSRPQSSAVKAAGKGGHANNNRGVSPGPAAAALSPSSAAASAHYSSSQNNVGATVRKVLSNAIAARSLSAAKPVQDFDTVIGSVDGSTNYSVLGANIAAAASIAFAKLRAQVQRTPLGLSQPLYRLLRADLSAFAASSLASPAAFAGFKQQQQQQQQHIGSGGGQQQQPFPAAAAAASGAITTAAASASTKVLSSSSPLSGSSPLASLAAGHAYMCPIPLVPLFGSDPPVFGKLRLLRYAVVYPSPAFFATSASGGSNSSSSSISPQQQLATIAAALQNVQRVAMSAFEKLTSDEATQQPAILLPHAGGIVKHVGLESISAVLEFADECIRDAKLVPGQDVMVGLVLDGSLCSPRAADQQQQQSGAIGGGESRSGASASSPPPRGAASSNNINNSTNTNAASMSKANLNSSKSQQQSQQQASLSTNAAAAAAMAAAMAAAAESAITGIPPLLAPKYHVIDGALEWTGAQLADHIAMAAFSKKEHTPQQQQQPQVSSLPSSFGFVQDSHREDDVAEMRRLMARVGKTMSVAGDEVFCSSQHVVERLAPECVANTLVVRVNDAGSLSAAASAARTFQRVVPGGSICVSAETCDAEAAAAVDFAYAVGARYVHCTGTAAGSGCQGSVMLSRIFQIAADIVSSSSSSMSSSTSASSSSSSSSYGGGRGGGDGGLCLSLPSQSSAELYSRIVLPPEPAEPLGQLELPTTEKKRKR